MTAACLNLFSLWKMFNYCVSLSLVVIQAADSAALRFSQFYIMGRLHFSLSFYFDASDFNQGP